MKFGFEDSIAHELVTRERNNIKSTLKRRRSERAAHANSEESQILEIQKRLSEFKIDIGRIIEYDDKVLVIDNISPKGAVSLVYKDEPNRKYSKTISIFSVIFENQPYQNINELK